MQSANGIVQSSGKTSSSKVPGTAFSKHLEADTPLVPPKTEQIRIVEEHQRSGAPSTPGTALIGMRNHDNAFDNYSDAVNGIAQPVAGLNLGPGETISS